MDDYTKKGILQTILSSQKIKSKYQSFRTKFKLNKRLIIERIINELEPLSKKFKDNTKLVGFLESFIVNHIKDFLIPRVKETDNYSRDTTINNEQIIEDSRIEEDPTERFNREMEQRKNTSVPSSSSSSFKPLEEDNEENMEKNNDNNNLETMNRTNNNYTNQNYNPYLSQNNNFTMNQAMPNMNQAMPSMNQAMPSMNQAMPNMNQAMPSMNQAMPNMNQAMPNMNQAMPNMNQAMPNMNQQGYAPSKNLRRRNEQPQVNFNQNNVTQPQMGMNQSQPQMGMNQNQPTMVMNQSQPTMVMNQNQPPMGMNQSQPQMGIVQSSTPISQLQNNAIQQQGFNQSQNSYTANHQESEKTTQESSIVKDESIDRSLIHIDSRERDFSEMKKSNPFNIQMNNKITCLICVKDLVINNIYSDPYLLIQIMESHKGVYENQMTNEIHFKMVKIESNRDSSYYKNIDIQTMIRLRDINTITFNVIRPNGKVLYSGMKDLYDIKVESREEAKSYLESKSILSEMTDKMELIHIESLDSINVEEGDFVTLFDKSMEDSVEFKVLHLNKKDNKILLETLDNRTGANYSKILLNKYQISITLEII